MNIVHVAAHQDDEVHSLGTLIKYQRQKGNKITFICTTNGNKGMSWNTDISYKEAAAIREKEMKSVADELNANYICLGAEDEFLYDTEGMRLKLIDSLRFCQADIIFTHWINDYNLDHTTTACLVFQSAMNSIIASMQTEHPALKVTPKIFYWDVGDGFGFEGTHFVEISEGIMKEKVRIIRLHESQMEVMRKRGPDMGDLLQERAVAVGRRVGVPFAEVFRPCLASRRTPLANLLP